MNRTIQTWDILILIGPSLFLAIVIGLTACILDHLDSKGFFDHD